MTEITDDFIERVAIEVHLTYSDDLTPKWAKQPGKYRAGIRRDVRDVLASLGRLGFSVEKISELARLRAALNGGSDAP